MSKSAKPGWPDLTALPFLLFGGQAPAAPTASPLNQGFASGVDAVNRFWGSLPGGTAVPGFLVPTLDVGELDKRIADLRAAEQWVEVNLNMLRATIQGLEVQRHTIAAIHSISAMADGGAAEPPAGLPPGWPISATTSTPPAPAAAPAPEPAAPAPVAAEPAESADAKPDAPSLLGLAANNWLGLLQDQFGRVAQAATAASSTPPATARKSAVPAKTARKAAAKRAGTRAGRTR